MANENCENEKKAPFGVFDRSKRHENDRYLTPVSMVTQLLDVEHFDLDTTFLECCSNHEKHIEQTLRQRGFTNIFSNVYVCEGLDFLNWNENVKFDVILSNTPYKNATDFILKCLQVATKKVCLLYPASYIAGIDRYQRVWSNIELGWSLTKLYIFVRPSLLKPNFVDPNGIYYESGSLYTYAWYVWEPNPQKIYKHPTLHWINNQEYVLGSDVCKYSIQHDVIKEKTIRPIKRSISTINTKTTKSSNISNISNNTTTKKIKIKPKSQNNNESFIRFFLINGTLYLTLKDICLFYKLDAEHSKRPFENIETFKYSQLNKTDNFINYFKIPPNGNVISYEEYVKWRKKQNFTKKEHYKFDKLLCHQQIIYTNG